MCKALIAATAIMPIVQVLADEPESGDEATDTTYYTYDQFKNSFKSWRGNNSFNKVVSLGWKGVAAYMAIDIFAAALAYVVAIMKLGSVDDPRARAEAKQALLSQIVTIALLGATPGVIMIFSVLYG